MTAEMQSKALPGKSNCLSIRYGTREPREIVLGLDGYVGGRVHLAGGLVGTVTLQKSPCLGHVNQDMLFFLARQD